MKAGRTEEAEEKRRQDGMGEEAEEKGSQDGMGEETDAEGAEKAERELSELEKENERLRKENELLKEYRTSLPLKERLYDRIPLTVKQLDWIILILLAVLVGVVALGLLDR